MAEKDNPPFSVRMSGPMNRALDAKAKRENKHKASIVRDAVEAYLDKGGFDKELSERLDQIEARLMEAIIDGASNAMEARDSAAKAREGVVRIIAALGRDEGRP